MLDVWLGKVCDIVVGVLMENGDVVLIVDVDDLLCLVDKFVCGG